MNSEENRLLCFGLLLSPSRVWRVVHKVRAVNR
jgi:hypothetical protein